MKPAPVQTTAAGIIYMAHHLCAHLIIIILPTLITTVITIHGPDGGFGSYQVSRYYADNIAIIAFDSTANLQWTNVIHKSQFDDYTDNFIGYGTLNTGGKFHFLFNQLEKRTLLLTEQTITPDGEINRSPTLRNLSKEYQFMPRYAKQVSSYELVVPCQYRNYICFAKIEY